MLNEEGEVSAFVMVKLSDSPVFKFVSKDIAVGFVTDKSNSEIVSISAFAVCKLPPVILSFEFSK